MRVRISYSVDLSEDNRRAIRHYYGQKGLATRAEVRSWFYLFGNSMNDDMSELAQQAEEEENERTNG